MANEIIVSGRFQRRPGLLGIEDQWVGQIGCSEYRTLLIQIEAALATADSVGVSKTLTSYKNAKTLIDVESGTFTRSVVLTPNDCRNAIDYSTKVLADLTAAIKKKAPNTPDGELPDPFTPKKPPSTDDWLSALKWVGVGVGGLAVVYLFGPMIRSFASGARPGFAGLDGRRRSRRRQRGLAGTTGSGRSPSDIAADQAAQLEKMARRPRREGRKADARWLEDKASAMLDWAERNADDPKGHAPMVPRDWAEALDREFGR